MEEFSYNENVAGKLLEGFNDFDLKNHQFVFLFNQLINNSPARLSQKNGSKNNYDYRFELANHQQVKRFLNSLSKLHNF
jgi:hypothetical protein